MSCGATLITSTTKCGNSLSVNFVHDRSFPDETRVVRERTYCSGRERERLYYKYYKSSPLHDKTDIIGDETNDYKK